MQKFNYFNGRILPGEETNIHVSDLALLRGYGIFDFLRVIDGKPVFLEDHLDRFENGAEKMRLTVPENRIRLREIITALIQLNSASLLGIKLILTGGYSADGYTPAPDPNFIILANPFTFPDPIQGVALMSLEYRREIAGVKTLNYISPIRMLPRLKETKAFDYLYFFNGLISESSRSNVFIVKNEKVITARTDVLPGITRKYVMKACIGNFELEERDVSLAEAFAADEVFMTASNQRILPVAKIDQQLINYGKTGKVTQKLQELLLKQE